MLLYTVFVSSALTLASQNMLYAIVAMAFIVPAEQIVKKMFGIHGNTESSISGFAGGAVAGTLLNRLNKPPKHAGSGGGSGSGSSQSKPRIARNPSGVKEMDAITTGSVPTGNNGGADAGAQPDGAGGVPAPATANSAPATAAYTYINGRRYYTARPGGTQPGGGWRYRYTARRSRSTTRRCRKHCQEVQAHYHNLWVQVHSLYVQYQVVEHEQEVQIIIKVRELYGITLNKQLAEDIN